MNKSKSACLYMFIAFSILIISFKGVCQEMTSVLLPTIGTKMPEFRLHNIENYFRADASLGDFKGKWLILDFWHKYCSSCVSSFKEIDQEQKDLKDSVQFMLIGREDPENKIREMYQRFKIKQNLKLAHVFDSSLANRFDILNAPYIIIIDPFGVVRGITSSLSHEDLISVIRGKVIQLPKAYRIHESSDDASYDMNIPLLMRGNGGSDSSHLYRSVISKWNKFIPKRTLIIRKGRFEALGFSLMDLYKLAYLKDLNSGFYYDSLYGKLFPYPVLETKDSALFKSDYEHGMNLFCYSLSIPSLNDTIRLFANAMQSDLQKFFKFKVRVSSKTAPYWRLVVSEKSRVQLPNKTDSFSYSGISHAGFSAKNYPMIGLIAYLWACDQQEPPFINETGINGNINIVMDAIDNDFEDVKVALKRNGLDLIKGEKEMTVLEIMDN